MIQILSQQPELKNPIQSLLRLHQQSLIEFNFYHRLWKANSKAYRGSY